MALNDKKYEKFYSTSGSDADKADAAKLTKAERDWDYERATGCEFYLNHDEFAPLLFQLQQMQDELDALRTEISANKDKATFPGFGTSGTTALAGNTTTISNSQANAITANTAKNGISDSQADAITANTAKVTFPVTYHEALLGSLSFAVDKTGAGLTISNTYTEKGKSVTKSLTLTLK
tara:strand:- start:2233 stop:2769 length:537 start_codon:yes stop_codon:yes gene_type:complete